MPTPEQPVQPTRRQRAIVYAKLGLLLAAGVLAYLHLAAPLFSWLQGRPSCFLVWNPGPVPLKVHTTNLLLFRDCVEVPPDHLGRLSTYLGATRTVSLRFEGHGTDLVRRLQIGPDHTALVTPVPLWCVAADQAGLSRLAVQPLLAAWLEQLANGKIGEAERLACVKKLQAELNRHCHSIEIREMADDRLYDLSPIAARDLPGPLPASQRQQPLLIMPDLHGWLQKPLALADSQLAILPGHPARLMVTLVIPWGKHFPALGQTNLDGSLLTVTVVCEEELCYTEAKVIRQGQSLGPGLRSN